MGNKKRNAACPWLDIPIDNQSCDLCKDDAEYHLCQFHMNECVIGERDLKAELEAARTASSAWKAKCKYYRQLYDIAVDEQCKGRDRVIAAEKRVQELEGLLGRIINEAEDFHDAWTIPEKLLDDADNALNK